MIAELTGTFSFVDTHSVVVDVGGVGYLVHLPPRHLSKVNRGEAAHLFTYQVVREDDLSLYGFFTREERHLFSVLISVSGIGPKAALALSSAFPVEKLVTAITQGQIEMITTVPGIGRKTAERLIVELREKVAKLFGTTTTNGHTGMNVEDASVHDAISALVTLGFSPREAREAIQRAGAAVPGAGVEAVVREALKGLR